MSDWYIARNKKKFGPVSLAKLKQLADAGQLGLTDHLLQEGTQKWVLAKQIKGLFAANAVDAPNPAPRANAVPPARGFGGKQTWILAAVGAAVLVVAVVSGILYFGRPPATTTPAPDIVAKNTPELQPEVTGSPQSKPEPKPEQQPESKTKTPPKAKPTPIAQPDPEPGPNPGQVTTPPELKQTVRSIRVVLADPLAREPILKLIRAKYEPLGIKVVVGQPGDKDPIQEDVTLIATYFSQPGMFGGQKTESAYYLWVDMRKEIMVMVDQRSTNTFAPLDGFHAPGFVYDPAPLIESRIETRSGIPTDDLKFVFFREGNGPETIAVFDVAKKDVASRQKVQGKWSSRLILGDEILCSVNDQAVELFNRAALPSLGQGHTFFLGVDSQKIKDVALQGRNLLALVDDKLNVIHWPKGERPRVSFTDNAASGLLMISATGELRLFNPVKPGSEAAPMNNVRLGRLAPDGTVQLKGQASISSKDLTEDDARWRHDRSGCLRANLDWFHNGRLQLWWHGDAKKAVHLCDLPMVAGSKVKAVGVKGLPVWERGSLLLAGPLLASYAQDHGVRKLPSGQLLVYYGGTVLRLKNFSQGAGSAIKPESPAPPKTVSIPMKPAATDLHSLQPITGKPVDRGVALERFTKILPVGETKKWLDALRETTGKDNSTLFLQCVSSFGHKTGALFDGDMFRPEVSSKMLKRLNSLKRDDFRQWHGAFDDVMGQPCSDTAVALQLLPVDALFEGDAYAAAKAQKYLSRLKQLKRNTIDRWCRELPAFRDNELDAALTIALRDDCFDGERFNQAALDKLLAK